MCIRDRREPARRAAGDRELALVNRAMVRSAEHDQAFWIVGTPFGARIDVVDVDEHARPATGHGARIRVSSHHRATHRRCNRLRCALTHCSDALRVAPNHFHDLGRDGDRFAFALLSACAAVLADGHRDLIAGAALVYGPTPVSYT